MADFIHQIEGPGDNMSRAADKKLEQGIAASESASYMPAHDEDDSGVQALQLGAALRRTLGESPVACTCFADAASPQASAAYPARASAKQQSARAAVVQAAAVWNTSNLEDELLNKASLNLMALLGYTTNTVSNDAGGATLLLLKGTVHALLPGPASTDTAESESALTSIKALTQPAGGGCYKVRLSVFEFSACSSYLLRSTLSSLLRRAHSLSTSAVALQILPAGAALTLLLLKGTHCEDPASTDAIEFQSARIIIKALIAKDLECFKW